MEYALNSSALVPHKALSNSVIHSIQWIKSQKVKSILIKAAELPLCDGSFFLIDLVAVDVGTILKIIRNAVNSGICRYPQRVDRRAHSAHFLPCRMFGDADIARHPQMQFLSSAQPTSRLCPCR
jgi:hypothetical protein